MAVRLFTTVFLYAIASLASCTGMAQTFGRVQGIVHDPQHRPIAQAAVTLHAAHAAFQQVTHTDASGQFVFPAVPLGEYTADAVAPGFEEVKEDLSLVSASSPVLHFELRLSSVNQTVTVNESNTETNVDSVTPVTSITRAQIEDTPGAGRTNSQQMITEYVPGAYMTHDMLHMRGGHQVSWLIDGVQIPNTNIGSNIGAQIDPRDIGTLDVQRGSYGADLGDRTYGMLNVVPRNGFDRNREAELVVTAGSFLQTDDQINAGDHSEKSAYYVSVNGNRSDFGLSPPVQAVHHDAQNGYGGFLSVLNNRTPKDQLRFVAQLRSDFFQIPYDPDPNSNENQQYNSSGLRDAQHENDELAAFTWAHTMSGSAVLQVSPFYHRNRANYEPGANDFPVATTSDRTSQYGGLQTSFTGSIRRNTVSAGLYSFGQHDTDSFGSAFHDGSAQDFRAKNAQSGGLVEEYISDNYKPAEWITFIGGVRESYFRGGVTETATSPRVGVAVEVPKLRWVFRAFYGRFYQPPPLISVAGPVAAYATEQDTGFVPLHGERDEEHQFGVQIPFRGWLLDADTFQTRANNFLDHSNLGESSIYFPVSIDGALIQAWELTLTSPRTWRYGHAHLAYSNQVAKQRGALTGGLVCVPIASPGCDAGFDYTPLDHDQRNTLAAGYTATLPGSTTASIDVSYGSGFHNGSPDAQYPGDYLPSHTSVDLSASRQLTTRLALSVNAMNVANQRVLLDNSLTFGGFHYNDPRQIYGELRFRFHY